MGAEGEEGVHALMAAGVHVGDAEDVGCCVTRRGIAEEYWPARGGGADAVRCDEGWRAGGDAWCYGRLAAGGRVPGCWRTRESF